MGRKIILLLLIMIVGAISHTCLAQGVITDPSVVYTFGDVLIFNAKLNSDQPVLQSLIIIQDAKHSLHYAKPTAVTPIDENAYQLIYKINPTELHLPAFSEFEYYFQAVLSDGEVTQSNTSKFRYGDNRFKWQILENEAFSVNWIEGDRAFGQEISKVVHLGLERIESLLPLSKPEKVDIYVYPDVSKMQGALALTDQDWIAGHADVNLSTIVVTLPSGPDQRFLLRQRIPHELMHVYLAANMGDGYKNLPVWLVEGLASIAELYENPDYKILLENAYQEDQLLPIVTLCKSFPQDAIGALTAYAQSASFVSYIYDEFGSDGLEKLVYQFAAQNDCQNGVQVALEQDLDQLERQWRQEEFGESLLWAYAKPLLPWILLLLVIMVAPVGMVVAWMVKKPARINQDDLSKGK